jgi:hypothetical protein
VTGWGQIGAGKQAADGNDPHGGHGYIGVGDPALFRGEEGEPWMVDINCCLLGGCLLSVSLCRRGFQDLLKVRPSSLLMLCGCISSSVASLISPSMYPVLAERSLVSYNPPKSESESTIDI